MADSNVDSILIPREQAMLAKETIASSPVEIQDAAIKPEVAPPEIIESPIEAVELKTEEVKETKEENSPTEVKEEKDESPIDEYGNPTKKSKLYSEEEVQSLIRDRLKRGKRHEEPVNKELHVAADDFKADPESADAWEVQLGQFIDKKLEDRENKVAQQQWRQQEQTRQAEFESKFTTGMDKYSDFHSVVAGKPITDTMMLATRTLDNPAAFVYGASKMHPQELDRIARINDPYTQAAEVGRLHERMVKERKTLSNAPKPIEVPKTSLPNKTMNQPSLDDRISQHAKSKQRR